MFETYTLEVQLGVGGSGTVNSAMPISGVLFDVLIFVLQSDKVTASSNNVNVTVSEVLGEAYVNTLFAATYTGTTANRVAPSVAYVNASGVSTGLVRSPALNNTVRVACGSGTQNDWVVVKFRIIK